MPVWVSTKAISSVCLTYIFVTLALIGIYLIATRREAGSPMEKIALMLSAYSPLMDMFSLVVVPLELATISPGDPGAYFI